MDTTLIRFAGRDTLLADTGTAYCVRSGRVLVFVVPLEPETNVPLQRRLLYEAGPGCTIPSMARRMEGSDGKLYSWTLLLVPLEPAQLAPCADSTEIRNAFCRGLDSPLPKGDTFEESVIEFYNLGAVREMRNLYAAQKESSNAAAHSLHTMLGLFRHERAARGRTQAAHTRSALYDAAARLCGWQEISIAPLSTITNCCGRSFTAKDIARISKFACRDIVLTPDWYKKDSGPFLARRGPQRRPVACIPVRPGKYLLWDPEMDRPTPVTKETAQELDPCAMVFYRPFPPEVITLGRLIRFAAHELYLRDVIYILLFSLLGIAIGLLQSYLNQQLYDLFIPLGDVSAAAGICFVALSCSLGGLAFTVVKGLANFRAISRMKYAVQAAVMDRLFNLPESFFRQYDSADLAGRAMGISSTFELLAQMTVSVWLSAVFSAAYLWKMVRYSRVLSLHCILLLALVMASIALLGWRQLRFEKKRLELDGRTSSLLNQLILGITKLRTAGAEDRALDRYMELHTQGTRIYRKKAWYDRVASVVSETSSTLFSIVEYYQVIHGSIGLSVGAFMGFSSAFGSFSAAMMGLVNSWLKVNEVLPAFERMKPILETLPETQADAAVPGELEGNIAVDHVSFRYSEDAPMVLSDLSMQIKAGEYIGIVGPSGCGKSTLLKLLLGLETPQTGKIFYDDRDMESLDKRELRKRFGVVLQDGGIIPGSISDNITITCPSAAREEVDAAVQSAGLKADIAKMPMGLNTMLSEGDGTISGGQKQRVLIARAIVGKPKILFFDEATSALDNTTQRAVCDSLEKLHSTRIVIAHRLSTIMNCDRIYVLQKGRIEECGTYEELMKQHGFFYELAKRQLAE